jgi:hypothetical protein
MKEKTATSAVFCYFVALETIAASLAFLREALFLWIIFFLAALSSAEYASVKALFISSFLPEVAALRTSLEVFLIDSKALRFVCLRLIFWRMAFSADLVVGMELVDSY